jgi:chaperonin GroEL (HSP60 family)
MTRAEALASAKTQVETIIARQRLEQIRAMVNDGVPATQIATAFDLQEETIAEQVIEMLKAVERELEAWEKGVTGR